MKIHRLSFNLGSFNFARCRLTPKGAATQTKPEGAKDPGSEMLPIRLAIALVLSGFALFPFTTPYFQRTPRFLTGQSLPEPPETPPLPDNERKPG